MKRKSATIHFYRNRLLCLFITSAFLLLGTQSSLAQLKKKKLIKFSADNIEGDVRLGKDTKRLKGNVVFTQDDMIMYCDSAYLYPNNSLDAYDHVHIKQGDSLNLFGDNLKYDGNKKIAHLEKNIHLTDNDMNLETEHMTYDVSKKTATYFGGGTITSKENVLTSETGYYFAGDRMLAFKRKVLLTNPQYTVNCDTLNYSTPTRVAYFFGPTWIHSKKNSIYCENGFYDTSHDLAQFNQHAYILTDKQSLKGDSVFYDRKAGFGKALGNVTITDTSQHLTITGDYSTHNEITNTSYVTGHALMQQILKADTLLMHADSLKATSIPDSAALAKYKETHKTKKINPDPALDSLPHIRTMYAYHHVKFMQPQVQGKCDSLVYTYNDSTMHLFLQPVLWSTTNQLTAERVELTSGNGQMKLLKLFSAAFIVSKEDSIRFNQVKGKNMTGYFDDNKLRKVFVEGNGQTIYYVKDKNKRTGVNKADCSDLLIFLKDNQIESITLIKKPDGTIYPPNELDPKELRLKDFKDHSRFRPTCKADLFTW
jgi:lipopolysaccharide export system protein LptA